MQNNIIYNDKGRLDANINFYQESTIYLRRKIGKLSSEELLIKF